MTTVGLRVDVDTFRGTRAGVPRLLDALGEHEITASCFFTVGPDNMGRHLWRLMDPRFARKMIRSRAASLYGWDIVLAGTCWPGRRIGAKLGHVIRAAAAAGHEIGLHGWDHHRWQACAGRMSVEALRAELNRGIETLEDELGLRPTCSAAPGWICNERALEAKEASGFAYNSDCRGHGLFVPVVGGRACAPQIPTTLPTYDELMGVGGTTRHHYNDRLLALVRPDALNVLTIHAEVEGIACADLFDAFLSACRERAVRLVPLQALLRDLRPLPRDAIVSGPVPGRAGTVCWQRSSLVH